MGSFLIFIESGDDGGGVLLLTDKCGNPEPLYYTNTSISQVDNNQSNMSLTHALIRRQVQNALTSLVIIQKS